jgi:hypothetical protein
MTDLNQVYSKYQFNPTELDSVIGLALGPNGAEIHSVDDPNETDQSFTLAVERTCDWIINTYGEKQLIEKGLLIPRK